MQLPLPLYHSNELQRVSQKKHMELVLDKSMQHFDFSDYSRLSDEVALRKLLWYNFGVCAQYHLCHF